MARKTLNAGQHAEHGGLTEQLTETLRKQILSGELRPGDRLPPSRVMARDLSISRGTVVSVIDMLRAEELLVSRKGSGVFVSKHVDVIQSAGTVVSDDIVLPPRDHHFPTVKVFPSARIDLRPCRPSVFEFPLNAWRKCLTSATVRSTSPDYSDPQGVFALREQISRFARKSRGLQSDPDQVFISLGIMHAVSLLAKSYLYPGAKVIMEDPGYNYARQVFEHAGAEVLFCPVDEDGLIVDHLPRDPKDVVFLYLTPSHQFPMGARLSIERRVQIIDWATRNKVLVLEDDYDGEYRFDVPPLPPLASLPNQCVIYLGTFAKTLFPGIRIGYVIASRTIIQSLVRARSLVGYDQPTAMQHALCEFIASGHFEKHIARMSRSYREKRLTVIRALRAMSVKGRMIGLDSGLHGVLTLPNDVDATELSNALLDSGVSVPPVSFFQSNASLASNGLVIGYAAESTPNLSAAMLILNEELKSK
jgi:GntR family transcriptional regulator/MocR family aminotransferase